MTTDLTRYLPGIYWPHGSTGGGLSLWCTDCVADPSRELPFWTEDDAAEQVTELCLANLVAIADQHERQHHATPPAPSTGALTVGEAIIALVPGAAGVIRP